MVLNLFKVVNEIDIKKQKAQAFRETLEALQKECKRKMKARSTHIEAVEEALQIKFCMDSEENYKLLEDRLKESKTALEELKKELHVMEQMMMKNIEENTEKPQSAMPELSLKLITLSISVTILTCFIVLRKAF